MRKGKEVRFMVGSEKTGITRIVDYKVLCKCGTIAHFRDGEHVTKHLHNTPECNLAEIVYSDD